MLKLYLAAAYSRKLEMRSIAQQLNAMGHIVTSRWIFTQNESAGDQNHQSSLDLADIRDSDILIRFTDPETRNVYAPAKLLSSGRMFETGYAYALGKKIYVVGGHQCIFDNLHNVMHFNELGNLTCFLTNTMSGWRWAGTGTHGR